MNIGGRTKLAIGIGKIVSAMSRLFGLGAGYVWSGYIALLIDPRLIENVIKKNQAVVYVVTGTNGKTSTCKMLTKVLERAKYKVLRNVSGANMQNGIAGAIVENYRAGQKFDRVVMEIDEMAFRRVVDKIDPRALVVTNFSRDQLDRYGEVDSVAKAVREGIKKMKKSSQLILNADDPRVADLGKNMPVQSIYYGLEDALYEGPQNPQDVVFCSACGREYKFSKVFYGYLGHYYCEYCGNKRPAPAVYASGIKLLDGRTAAEIHTSKGSFSVELAQMGLHVVHNALAVTAVAVAEGIKPADIKQGLQDFKSAFGRGEELIVDGKKLYLHLVKNPVSFNQMLYSLKTRVATKATQKENLLIIINDNFQDGRDVSWLWDIDFDGGDSFINRVTVAGSRVYDMALRLKYAGIDQQKIKTTENIGAALDSAVKGLAIGERLDIFPNYTAMLEIRKIMADRGYLEQIWNIK